MRCRRRCRPRASSSPGWPGTAWTACPACGPGSHIEPGWETALEAALRERLNALAVGRLDTVRAFAADAPPAKLAFYSPPAAAIANTHRTLPRLSDLLRLNDAGLKALLNDWLEGVYTAASLDEALAARGQLTHGEVIMTREGHAVSQFAVAFYAPDSEQAGMLARAQEIENLDRQQRAQALIADEARDRARCGWRRPTPRPRSAWPARAARPAEAQTRAHQLQVELLRLSQQAEAASSRRAQLGDELRRDRRPARGAAGAARHRRRPLRGARHAARQRAGAPRRARGRGDRGRAPAGRRARAAARARAPGPGGAVPGPRAGRAARRAAARHRDRGAADGAQRCRRPSSWSRSCAASTTPRRRPACRRRWRCSSSASRRWPPRAANTTT